MSNVNNNQIFRQGRNEDIEILRGLAIVLVLIDHIISFWDLPFIQKFSSNYFSFWGGVDLFFAVSGFVIAQSILRGVNSDDGLGSRIKHLVSFWIRRVWRLWPAAWLWLIVFFVTIEIVIPEYRHGDNARALVASILGGLFNVVNVQQWMFKTGFGMPNLLWSQYWSLSLEEQLYLFTAPLLLFSKRRFVVMAMIVVIAAQFFLNRPANTSNLWWFIRSDAYGWGVLIALFWASGINKSIVEPTIFKSKIYAWMLLGLCVLAITSTQLLYSIVFDVGLIALASAILTFVASYDRGYLGIGGSFGDILSWLGDRSYSIYLVHGGVFVLILNAGPLAHLPRNDLQSLLEISVVVLVVSLLVAEISYRFIEVPSRLYGRKLCAAYESRFKDDA